MDECAYVDGVVFRKTVSHKKMVVTEISHHDENCDLNQVNKSYPNVLPLHIRRCFVHVIGI